MSSVVSFQFPYDTSEHLQSTAWTGTDDHSALWVPGPYLKLWQRESHHYIPCSSTGIRGKAAHFCAAIISIHPSTVSVGQQKRQCVPCLLWDHRASTFLDEMKQLRGSGALVWLPASVLAPLWLQSLGSWVSHHFLIQWWQCLHFQTCPFPDWYVNFTFILSFFLFFPPVSSFKFKCFYIALPTAHFHIQRLCWQYRSSWNL